MDEKHAGIEEIEFRLVVSDFDITHANLTIIDPNGKSTTRNLEINGKNQVFVANNVFPLDVLEESGEYKVLINLLDSDGNQYNSRIENINIEQDLIPNICEDFIEGLLDFTPENSILKLF